MVFSVCAPLHAQDHTHILFIIYTLLMIVIILTRTWHPKVKQKEPLFAVLVLEAAAEVV